MRKLLERLKNVNEVWSLKKKTYTIEASDETFETLEKLFHAMELCNSGMSRTIKIDHDGDGGASFKLIKGDTEYKLSDSEAEQMSNGGELFI